MTKKTKKSKLEPLSFKELNKIRGGGGADMIIEPPTPGGGG